jgi:D-alanyl-D-alanine endopeptidase (penicillin-binding protein 7)
MPATPVTWFTVRCAAARDESFATRYPSRRSGPAWRSPVGVIRTQGQAGKHLKLRRKVESMAMALCLLTALASVSATAAAKVESKPRSNPDLRSNAFYILDESGSKVLAARNEGIAAPIASITKLMTTLVVLAAGQPMEEMIAITRDDVRETARSNSRLAPGARLSRADLLHLALMSSENRAAHALCRSYPGGMPACVRAMNDKARSLGMTTARFVEPTGLSSSNVSSPVDLAKLVRAAAANATIRKYSTDPEHTVYVKGRALEYRSTNSLVEKPDWQVTVQKTGYNADAGRCLVMLAVIDGRDVVIVLLNSWGRLTRIGDANRIRDWMESSFVGGA